MGRSGNRVNIKTCQNNLAKVSGGERSTAFGLLNLKPDIAWQAELVGVVEYDGGL